MLVICNTPSKTCRDNEALALCIKLTSFEMFLCLGCEKRNTKCVVSDKENSGRCSKCVLRGASCDVKGILVGEWRSLEVEEERLQRKSKAAMRAVCENMSCLERLEKQKKFLKSKGKDIVRQGLKTLNKLKKVEEKEKQIKEEYTAVEAAAMLSIISQTALRQFVDPFAKIEIPLLPLEVWAN
jgi:hypothetical protein